MTRPDTIHRLTGRTVIFSKSGNDPSHDSLCLPNGKTIAESTTDEIRAVAAALEIPEAWTAGRAQIVSAYADRIGAIYHESGMAAVKNYLQSLEKQKC
jgi:hypothetical protein